MAASGETISIVVARDGGSFSAYLARPAQGSAPGLVLLQEIFGVNPTCARWPTATPRKATRARAGPVLAARARCRAGLRRGGPARAFALLPAASTRHAAWTTSPPTRRPRCARCPNARGRRRRARLLPRRQARLPGGGAHRCRVRGRLLRRGHRGRARRGRRHPVPAGAAHRRARQVLPARGARAGSWRRFAAGGRRGLRLSRPRPRLRARRAASITTSPRR